MKKWKCNDCRCEWGANTPIQCPSCGSSNFEGISTPPSTWGKYWWILLLGLLIIGGILFFVLRSPNPGKELTARVTYNDESYELVVVIDAKDIDTVIFDGIDFCIKKTDSYDNIKRIILSGSINNLFQYNQEQKGYVFSFNSDDFMSHGNGTYEIDFKCENDNVNLKVSGDTNFTVNISQDSSSIPLTPIIKVVKHTPNVLTSKDEFYKVEVELDELQCPKSECEFSIDGRYWRDESIFTDVEPGIYKVYVRNKASKTKVDVKDLALPAYNQKLISLNKEKINAMLSKIYDGNDAAFIELNAIGGKTKVVCDSEPNMKDVTGLALQATTTSFEVVKVEKNNNGVITKLVVREK